MADITEEFPLDLSTPSDIESFSNNISYDINIDSLRFILAASQEQPYRRETAQYRKDQSDSSLDAGEHSLMGWWLRSQSSFHVGAGVNFFEPAFENDKSIDNQVTRFRFNKSKGVNVWNNGEVTLLNASTEVDDTLTEIAPGSVRNMNLDGYGAIFQDENSIYKINSTSKILFVSSTNPIYGFTDDGVNAYWLTHDGSVWVVKQKPLSGDATDSSDITTAVTGAHLPTTGYIQWLKDRLFMVVDNVVYDGAASNDIYTFTAEDTVVTSAAASGSAVYVSTYNGTSSNIFQFRIDEATLSLIITGVAAELPRGEIVHSMYYYLGFLALGTNLGVRISQVVDTGGIIYGPILIETNYPVYSFYGTDRFVFATVNTADHKGLARIDLSISIDTLIFPYALDLYFDGSDEIVSVNGFKDTKAIIYSSATTVYLEDLEHVLSEGYIQTGKIRFNTLENKLFKFVSERASYSGGNSIAVSSVVGDTITPLYEGTSYAGNRDNSVFPAEAVEYISLRFTLKTTANDSPIFNGYQLKALPAAKRQRLIQYPLYNYDFEKDKFNNKFGYAGRAYGVLKRLESIEESGDVVQVTDNRTGETFKAFIEEISFLSTTATDKNNSNFGGILSITVRKI